MNILAIDVGGTHVKVLVSGQDEPRKFDSGPDLTAEAMVRGVKEAAEGWEFDSVAMGYPGIVLRGRPITEPANLGPGWVGFDYESAFGRPVKIVNDAAMQALGSYKGGRLLFLGLGTGLGSAMVVDGVVEPLELAHMPYRKGTFEDYVGEKGFKRLGKKRWRKRVEDVIETLTNATEPTDVVIGGGNVNKLKGLPPKARAGGNEFAFLGGFRLWEGDGLVRADVHPAHGPDQADPPSEPRPDAGPPAAPGAGSGPPDDEADPD